MKSNLRFIFPRLIGATLVVGLAALIVTTLFKLLLGVVLIVGLVSLIRRIAGRDRSMQDSGQFGQNYNAEYVSLGGRNPWSNQMTVNPIPVQRQTTIIPIN